MKIAQRFNAGLDNAEQSKSRQGRKRDLLSSLAALNIRKHDTNPPLNAGLFFDGATVTAINLINLGAQRLPIKRGKKAVRHVKAGGSA
jgi:hypothetical protein